MDIKLGRKYFHQIATDLEYQMRQLTVYCKNNQIAVSSLCFDVECKNAEGTGTGCIDSSEAVVVQEFALTKKAY